MISGYIKTITPYDGGKSFDVIVVNTIFTRDYKFTYHADRLVVEFTSYRYGFVRDVKTFLYKNSIDIQEVVRLYGKSSFFDNKNRYFDQQKFYEGLAEFKIHQEKPIAAKVINRIDSVINYTHAYTIDIVEHCTIGSESIKKYHSVALDDINEVFDNLYIKDNFVYAKPNVKSEVFLKIIGDSDAHISDIKISNNMNIYEKLNKNNFVYSCLSTRIFCDAIFELQQLVIFDTHEGIQSIKYNSETLDKIIDFDESSHVSNFISSY